jgi:hypothetical protein
MNYLGIPSLSGVGPGLLMSFLIFSPELVRYTKTVLVPLRQPLRQYYLQSTLHLVRTHQPAFAIYPKSGDIPRIVYIVSRPYFQRMWSCNTVIFINDNRPNIRLNLDSIFLLNICRNTCSQWKRQFTELTEDNMWPRESRCIQKTKCINCP